MDGELILNRYRPLGEAGKGGFGTVQLAWDTRIQRRVAVKCMPIKGGLREEGPLPWQEPVQADGEEPLEADEDIPGLEEARTAALLQDPNIVGVLDFEARGETAYLIMEYVDGITLTQLLRDWSEEVDGDVVAAVLDGVSHALSTAHENAVLHLDIKPDNIMINHQGLVKVTDFGLAELSSAAGFSSAAGGTIGYMPPEQMRREEVDERCDEWALASVAYEMIAGENPFWANDIPDALQAIEQAELVLPSACLPELDPEADDVLFYALEPDRAERYETVRDFAEELLPFLGDVREGGRRLAEIVAKATDDAGEDERLLAHVPLIERIGMRKSHLMMRVWSMLNVGLLAGVSLQATPPVGGVSAPAFWGLMALALLAAASVPHIGALLAAGSLAVALMANGAVAPGIVLAAAACLWWFFAGRHGHAQANTGLSSVLLGVAGMGNLSALLAGYFLNLRQALASTALSAMLALFLGCAGAPAGLDAGSALAGWAPGALSLQILTGQGYLNSLGQVLVQPQTYLAFAPP